MYPPIELADRGSVRCRDSNLATVVWFYPSRQPEIFVQRLTVQVNVPALFARLFAPAWKFNGAAPNALLAI